MNFTNVTSQWQGGGFSLESLTKFMEHKVDPYTASGEMKLIATSLCFILVAMLSLAFSDRSKCLLVLCISAAPLVHDLFHSYMLTFMIPSGIFSSLYFALRVDVKKNRAAKVDSKEGKKTTMRKQNRKHARGSFLLHTDPKELSKTIKSARMSMKQIETDTKLIELGRELISKRSKSLGPNVSCFYADEGGLVITKGEGSYLIDPAGNRYLDCCNNVAAVGHSHPKVVKAGINALSEIQTNSRFLHPSHQRYIDKLLNTFPAELDTVYLVNSGSEANDLALRIARAHADVQGIATKPNDVICLDSAYHGHTQSLVEISPYKWYQNIDGKDYKGPHTHVVSLPDTFRGKHRGWNKETGLAYSNEVKDIVEETNGVGVFIAESVVGCGGQVCLPPGYLAECYDVVRGNGGVVIADEIQTGFARSGEHFWHFQTYGVVPDIVSFGKPCGNGYPIAGVVCKREVAESFAKSGIEYFNTYGGNSVACSIAESVLDVIEEENLLKNANDIGKYIVDGLLRLQNDYDCIGDVRGQGLFLGIEFVVSRQHDLRPDAEVCKFVVDFLRYQRIIVSRDGPDHNVIKIKPPLVWQKTEADTLLALLFRL
eukprot:CAMPEP_0178906144 /NCGR_PEP_ID=MMETSP0786-20121207/6664_1 /TAXON_ID=186022 /ORGANISM="Thalassionema frauenfeldii, Strain CCMP 1798" /LENGTH=597 /DNA_ID=CAMNT_0020577823 /DNA_START=128 /DNA_END=1921 /DNA_ORIENTATION=+